MATHVFNKLGQSVLPKVFDKLSGVGLTDLMDVKGETLTVGSGGGRIKSAATVVYKDVPLVFMPDEKGYKNVQGDKLTSRQQYIVKFPSHNKNGVRYAVDPSLHRLHVKSRILDGDEPAKVFRIIAIRDIQGNLYEAEIAREDAE
jgi:hypothetical protein